MTHTLIITNSGHLLTLGNPLGLPGVVESKRWSEIIPCSIPKRIAFRVLRYLFGERGRVAQWTRGWRTTWQMTVLSTGYTARCNDRQSLIQLEHEQFNQQPV
jgi:hypothetical protein